MTLPTRRLGSQGLQVSAQGLGCLGMSENRGFADRRECIATIHRAIELGVRMFDTADVYGPFTNEQFVGAALGGYRNDVVVATKFGVVRDQSNPNDLSRRRADGSPAYVRSACDASLHRLGMDQIDLYYYHRVDVTTPIEETVGAMGELVAAGKVRYLGLSECGPEVLRRAHATHPISALQSEWSVVSRDLEREVVPVARELGIGIVAYSPLGRGLVTGALRPDTVFHEHDSRRHNPRFTPERLAHNLRLVSAIRDVADERGCSVSQLALMWTHARGDDVVPLPGTTCPRHLESNVEALGMDLDDATKARLEELASAVLGDRYGDMSFVAVDVPPRRG